MKPPSRVPDEASRLARQGDRNDQIGRSAEKLFAFLCSQEGILSSPPDGDRFGWDYFLEIPSVRQKSVSVDEEPAPAKCLCQVKATTRFHGRLYIEVSKLAHLAKTPLPAFLIIARYSAELQLRDFYLCHIDDERIEGILRKLRSCEADGRNPARTKMSFIPRSDELVTDERIRDRLLAHIGGDVSAYVTQKSALVKSVGYDDQPYRLTVMSEPVSGKDVVDVLLGKRTLAITEGTVRKSRFGIERVERPFGHGVLTVTPKASGECLVRVFSEAREIRSSIVANLFVPPLRLIPKDLWRFRVQNHCFEAEITCKSSVDSFSVKIDPTAPQDLKEFIEACSFLDATSEAGSQVAFIVGGKTLMKGDLQFQKFPASIRAIINRAKAVEGILVEASIRDTLTVIPVDFMMGEGSALLEANGSNPTEISVSFKKTFPEIARPGIFARPLLLKGVEKCLVFYCWWDANFTSSGSNLLVTIGRRHLFDARLLGSADEDTHAQCVQELNAYCSGKSDLVFKADPPSV